MQEQLRWRDQLNLKKVCRRYRVGLWQCPQFLFVVMGFIVIVAIFATYLFSNRYQDPDVAALIVLMLAALLFTIGNLIVKSFERVALAALAKSEFISIMSHQLRSPLSAIKWQLNILLSGEASDSPMTEAIERYLDTINSQNERMIHAVNDILDVNRIEDGDMMMRPMPFLLSTLTKNVIDGYSKYAIASNLKISLDAPLTLPAVFADEDKIKRAMEHLLDNAIRYSIKGGEVNIAINVDGGKVTWKITDHGIGISPEDQKHIFDKFFRSESIMRYQTEGSGVGLFVAKSIVKLSGGEISFSSKLNEGSTFWFSLPINK